jgi:hypothetical protein
MKKVQTENCSQAGGLKLYKYPDISPGSPFRHEKVLRPNKTLPLQL